MYRFLAVLHTLGFTMALFSTTMFFPMGASIIMGDGQVHIFVQSFMLSLGLGVLCWLGTMPFRGELRPRDGFLLVSMVWTMLPLMGSIPLMLYFSDIGQPISFTHAYYEAMSGLTATGGTVLTGLDGLAPSINIWRGTMVWVGGMGILVLAVAILPLLGVGGHQVFRAETPGPMKDEKLTPRIASTAKALYAIYFGLSILCFLAYRVAGMSWFDAWVHMSTTMGLGGFSSHDDSFAHFDSVAIECVAMVFMLIAGINFATHFTALRSRSGKPYLRCPETLPYLGLVLTVGLLIAIYLWVQGVYDSPLEALRYSMFNTISVATTTGYANTDYALWPVLAPMLMLGIAAISTSSGSTGGGIKMMRALMLFKQARQELVGILHPHAVTPVLIAGRSVSSKVLASVLAFMLLYGLSMALLVALMLLSGLDPMTAISAVWASVNNIGPGLGGVGPAGNYQALSHFQIWLCTFAMMIGRLELFTVLVLFTPGFWRK